jgi:hypothetical protein
MKGKNIMPTSPLIKEVLGDVSGMKTLYSKFTALGEGAVASDFYLIINGNVDLKFLCQSAGIPELGREVIEFRGPRGILIKQPGHFINATEIPISFKEVVSGKAYAAIKKLVINKTLFDASITLLSENEKEEFTVSLYGCWLALEGAALSVDDTDLVQPSGTLYVNWIAWEEGEKEE